MRSLGRGIALAMLLPALVQGSVGRIEPFLDLSLGKSFPGERDLRIDQPDRGTDLTIHEVPFDDQSFVGPVWYRLRVGTFFARHRWLGVAVELVHPKIYARTASLRQIEGMYRGAAIDTLAPIDHVVQRFGISHGINHLAFEGIVRLPLTGRSERFTEGRLQALAGLGVGPVIAHPENEVDGESNPEGYEVAGLGMQGFVGLRAIVTGRLGVIGEWKFTGSNAEVRLASGRAGVRERTHHLSIGMTLAFARG